MYSLAVLVMILMGIVIFSGPIGFLLTSKKMWNYSKEKKALWIIRRILVAIIAAAGSLISLMLVFNSLPLGPKLLAMAGFSLNIFALKREFFRDK
jgi:Na+/alanine symporter